MMKANDKKFWNERQLFKKSYGWYTAEIDGVPGSLTKEATKKFQDAAKKHKNKYYCPTCAVDGDWGNETEKAYQNWIQKEEIDVTFSVDSIGKDMFKDMTVRFDKYSPKTDLNRVYLSWAQPFRRYITKNKYLEMKSRWDKWKNANGGKDPEFIWINSSTQLAPVSPSTPTSGYATPFLAKFADAVGRGIRTWEDVCLGIKNRRYLYYYNDVYSQAVALTRLKNRQGLNCTDICQLVVQALKDLGYEARYRHIMCKQGGHIQAEVRGKELGSNWKVIDPSNPLANGGSCSNLWCAGTSRLLGHNPGWITVDNGVM
jgi:peptidoglycan hydrolase-like protein with peptidoglycan-binding domain